MYFRNDEIEVWSATNGLSVITDAYCFTAPSIGEELAANPLLAAAVEYLGIQNAAVSATAEYSTDGSQQEITYKITEKSNDTWADILNHSFSYITVTVCGKGELFLLQIRKVSLPEVSGEYALIPYTDVPKKIMDRYSIDPTSEVRAEIYYNSTAAPGYYVPCYRLYFTSADSVGGEKTAQVIDVAAVDLSAVG